MSTFEVADAQAPTRRGLLLSLIGQGFLVDCILDPSPLVLFFLYLVIDALLQLPLEEARAGRPMPIA